MNLQKETAKKIREARKEAGLTQRALADKLQYTPQAIVMIEKGDRNLGLDTLEMVAKGIGCEIILTFKIRANKG